MPLSPAVLISLVVAGGALALLGATLCGVWIGFRVVRGDAALLALVGQKADGAAALARVARDEVKALAEEIEDHAERMERKRASIAGTLHALERRDDRDEKTEANGTPTLAGDPLAGLSGAARRLAGQRLFGGGRV